MEKKMEQDMRTAIYEAIERLYELWSKLLQGGYVGDYIWEHYRGEKGGYLEFRL